MKSFHIAAYSFMADIMCCDCVANFAEFELRQAMYNDDDIKKLAQGGPDYDAGVFAHRSEGLLYELAEIWRIDYTDAYSYDSDEFPKVIFADQIESRERCGECGERIYE